MVGKIVLALLILVAGGVILWDRLRLRRTMGALDAMLGGVSRGVL